MGTVLTPTRYRIDASPLVGIAGAARAGKDTTAHVLVEHGGFAQYAFADQMRDALTILNPYILGSRWSELHERSEFNDTHLSELEDLKHRFASDVLPDIFGQDDIDYPTVCDVFNATDPVLGLPMPRRLRFTDALKLCGGWEKAKSDPDVGLALRGLMQRFGTDAMRTILGDDIWVHALARRIWMDEQDRGMRPVVISDVRFASEAQWVRDHGGVIVRVHRQGTLSATHASELPLPSNLVDYEIANYGARDEYTESVRRHLLPVLPLPSHAAIAA